MESVVLLLGWHTCLYWENSYLSEVQELSLSGVKTTLREVFFVIIVTFLHQGQALEIK